MSTLVLGGTGTVGSAVVNGLLERGEAVSVLTRSPDRAETLPQGADAVIGDLQDPATYEHVFAGVERLFLLNAVAATELQEGLAALNEAQRVGVRRLVYLSVHDADAGPHIPHFASKVAIELAIKASGIPYTVLRPNNFYQNDVWYRDAIVDYGVYPQPLGGAGVSRVDVRDIAAAAVNALTQAGHENRTYALVGPEALTGEGTARAYGEALGREVRYMGDDLDAWQEQALQMLPAWMVYDFRLMYAHFQTKGLIASEQDLRDTESVVGAPPRRFADFVREAVAAWQA
ncbi:MAG TPA: NmrA family NAD(P)-binding protein [Longimicrobiaceae bacterium]|nr:NmrA family NAD(P)-binding protein [Longimicrobiaceae bacterium]